MPSDTPTNAAYAKLPDYVTIKGTIGELKSDINKPASHLNGASESLGPLAFRSNLSFRKLMNRGKVSHSANKSRFEGATILQRAHGSRQSKRLTPGTRENPTRNPSLRAIALVSALKCSAPPKG